MFTFNSPLFPIGKVLDIETISYHVGDIVFGLSFCTCFVFAFGTHTGLPTADTGDAAPPLKRKKVAPYSKVSHHIFERHFSKNLCVGF